MTFFLGENTILPRFIFFNETGQGEGFNEEALTNCAKLIAKAMKAWKTAWFIWKKIRFHEIQFELVRDYLWLVGPGGAINAQIREATGIESYQ